MAQNSKGQVTIPKAVRNILDLKAGDKLELILDAKACSIDLMDLLIALSAKNRNCETLVTFDEADSKTKYFRLLE